MKRFLKQIAFLLGLAGLVAAGLAALNQRNATSSDDYQLTTVKKGDLAITINATGTLEPEEVIDVGAQVAGRISSFGKDKKGKTIDYGSAVEAGTILARIDDSLYQSDVEQARADLTQAKANVAKAQADLGQLQAKLDQAQADWKRAQDLGPSDALSRSAFDAYKAAYETAKANLAVGMAAVDQNKGAVLKSEAALNRAQRNLSYCTIVSPVSGVIIDRRVNIGQTVVASLNAPSLFLIAKDLGHMQVWVPVNEADISNIRPGQPATFTVDAHPGKTFEGKVGKIRLNASMTQNVVTYTVEVLTDNSKRVLFPYLTANVRFEVARKSDVFLVPNAALKWTPKPEQMDPQFAQRPENLGRSDSGGDMRSGVLWTTAEKGVRPVPVYTSLSDGLRTAIQGDGIAEGMKVIVGESQPDSHSTQPTSNPFTPQFRGRQGGGSRGQH
jgi:HlyD family secretion protein